jgi:protein-tyrosine phosphatase
VTNDFGRLPYLRVWRLLEEGLVHFVASDSHSPTWRPPGLSTAFAAIERRLGTALSRQLLVDNPACVLADLPLAAPVAASSGDVP